MNGVREHAGTPAAPLRVAIVGAGRMGLQHARAVTRLRDRAELVALVDPSESARSAARRLFPGVETYASLAGLSGERDGGRAVDVVHVCTPPDDHVATALAALAAGCHVYVEKPVAPTRGEAAELLHEAESRGLLLCAGHQILFERAMAAVRAALPAAGRVVHVESYFAFRTVRRSPDGRAPLRADLQLLDILPHPVYLLVEALDGAGSGAGVELAAVETGPTGTVHALVRSDSVTGTLVVSLEARPVEHFLRIVGTNGELYADFVRGTARRRLGPGTSGIDKALDPYGTAWQTVAGTTTALLRRALARTGGYPSLAAAIAAFYRAIETGAPSPTSPAHILATTSLCEAIAEALARARETRTARATHAADTAPGSAGQAGAVAVTGGTGFLGRAVVRALQRRGYRVRVLARRTPPDWERAAGAEYVAVDLALGCDPDAFRGCRAVVHCAAETAGGFAAHERNSVAAAEHAFLAAVRAGVDRFIHVSSLSAVAPARGPMSEASPLEAGRDRGAYAWGKAETERRLRALAREHGRRVVVVRPGAIIDLADFEPAGRLGRRVGGIFLAPGPSREPLGVVELDFAAAFLAWCVDAYDDVPDVVHLLDPEQPTRRALVAELRRRNPGLRVIWIPRPVLEVASLAAIVLQKALRPGRPATSLARVFRGQRHDLSTIRALAPRVAAATSRSAGAPAANVAASPAPFDSGALAAPVAGADADASARTSDTVAASTRAVAAPRAEPRRASVGT